jgi:hypothetical protein
MVKNGENIEERDVKESKSRDQKWKDSGENKWRDNYTSDVIDTANAEGNDEACAGMVENGVCLEEKEGNRCDASDVFDTDSSGGYEDIYIQGLLLNEDEITSEVLAAVICDGC